jgi:rubrerythrin
MLSTEQVPETRHVRFNASEVLEIAEQIKCNAARFYYKAAGLFADFEIRDLILELADWETRHENAFADMRRELSEDKQESSTCEFEYYTLDNARAIAGLTVFADKPYPSHRLTGRESKQQILKKAIRNELDIIVFFRGLKDHFARDQAARDESNNIIKEEMRLIDILKQLLQQALVGEPTMVHTGC